jgi:hypothetical protein
MPHPDRRPAATPSQRLPAQRGLLTCCQCLKMKAASRLRMKMSASLLKSCCTLFMRWSPSWTGQRSFVHCPLANMTSLTSLKIRSHPCSWWSRHKTLLPLQWLMCPPRSASRFVSCSGLVTICCSTVAGKDQVASFSSSPHLELVKSVKTKPLEVVLLVLPSLRVVSGKHRRKALLAAQCLIGILFPNFNSRYRSLRKLEWCPLIPERRCARRLPIRPAPYYRRLVA